MLVKFLKQSWLVMVSSLVFGLLVAVVNGTLEGRIADNARQKLDRELKALLGEDSSFATIPSPDGKTVLYYTAQDPAGNPAGYAIEAAGSGFADKIILLVAMNDKLDKLLGIAVLKSNETPGFGDKIKAQEFRRQFANHLVGERRLMVIKFGTPVTSEQEIVGISGATISSAAVTQIVNDAVSALRERVKQAN